MVRRLEGKVAVITGSTSGIGRATTALFLASDESSFITGHALVVDGGLTIQLQEAVAHMVEDTLRENGGKW